MQQYKINILTLVSIFKTNKTFIMFNTVENRINDFSFSDDNKGYFNKSYKHFRLIDDIKKQINNNLKIY